MSKRSDKFQNLINRQRERERDSTQPADEIVPGGEYTLSPSETEELNRCERIIDKGLRTFFEVGAALLRVRDLRLYRVEYSSFETYCSDRWGIERRRAYQLMDAARVTESVNNCTQIDPANEAQVRPLTRLSNPDQQRQAWEQVVQLASGARITARLVEQVVDDLLQQQAAPRLNKTYTIEHEATATEPTTDDPQTDVASAQTQEDTAALRERSARLEQRLAAIRAILEEYQEHVTRAQQYKPTSDRGEAVSPLLRALERVWLEIQEEARTKQ